MWLNTVDVYSSTTHSCKPATSLPKECAYGSAVAIGNKLFYVGGGNGFDWFSSMLRLPLDDVEGDWEQVPLLFWVHVAACYGCKQVLTVSCHFAQQVKCRRIQVVHCMWQEARGLSTDYVVLHALTKNRLSLARSTAGKGCP